MGLYDVQNAMHRTHAILVGVFGDIDHDGSFCLIFTLIFTTFYFGYIPEKLQQTYTYSEQILHITRHSRILDSMT